MKDEIIYYCNTCKKEIKNPDLHNKKTKGKHDIRMKGFLTISGNDLKESFKSEYLKINEDGSLIVKWIKNY